jgi:hypothetical protein
MIAAVYYRFPYGFFNMAIRRYTAQKIPALEGGRVLLCGERGAGAK